MLEAVFISDLHLHPKESAITERFHQFLHWAKEHTKCIYILGDFFHAWPGDDGIDAFSLSIIEALNALAKQGIALYFMPGNRDFLIGKNFIKQAGLTLLKDPTCIYYQDKTILLSHGDAYCTLDKGHQWLIRCTRNRIFSFLFQCLPLKLRQHIVGQVRKISAQNKQKPQKMMDTVDASLLAALKKHQATILIHGHTHKPERKELVDKDLLYQIFVLSDWDDNPQILCYDTSLGFYFVHDLGTGGFK